MMFCLVIYSCSSRENLNSIEYQKIWSKNILSIEFTKSDTIPFFADTLIGTTPERLIFIAKDEFDESELLGIPSSFKEWLNPLKIDRQRFVLSFEVKKVSQNWLCVKNSYSSSFNEFLWIPIYESKEYEIITWNEFLLSLEKIITVQGNSINNLRTSPSLDSNIINKPNIDCLRINRIFEDVWLEVAYTNYCGDFRYEKIGYIMWKDENNNLLIKF
jgi:hypothetical protein